MNIDLLIYTSILILSFFILIKSADFLVSSSSVLGQRAGISKFVIGLTIIAIGTSLPELITSIVSIFSSEENVSSFVLGTVIGSNIANTLLVFGILLLLCKKFKTQKLVRDQIFLLISTILLGIGIIIGFFNFYLGLILIFLFLIYMYISVKFGNKKDFEEELEEVKDETLEKKKNSILVLILTVSIIGLSISAKGIVFSIEKIGPILGLSIEFLALTTVALATSLPEIIVTISAIKRNEISLGVGNIIGSNISNILLILGSSAIIGTLYNNPLNFNPEIFLNSFIMLLIITLLFILIIQKKELTKNHGIFFLILYLFYIIIIF